MSAMSDDSPAPPAGTAKPSDPSDRASDLRLALSLMAAREEQILPLVYAEEAQDERDAEFIEALHASLDRVSDDRASIRGDEPAQLLAMIAKYRRVVEQDVVDFE